VGREQGNTALVRHWGNYLPRCFGVFLCFFSKSMPPDGRIFVARYALLVERHFAKVDRFIDSACPSASCNDEANVKMRSLAQIFSPLESASLRMSALLGPARNFRELCHLSQSSFKESRYLKEKRVIPAKNSRVRARDSLAFFLLTRTFR